METAQKAALRQINKVMSSKSQGLAEHDDGGTDKSLAGIDFLTVDNVGEIICESQDGRVVYYVITLKPEGWVIVSADDVARPIIAYSEAGFYSALAEDQPPAFKAWMSNVKAEICNAITKKLQPLPEAKAAWEQIETGDISAAPVNNTNALAANVAPLIRTKWGQGEIAYFPGANTGDYNYYCPYEIWGPVQVFAVTGCVATAMAQIMKYYEWPAVGQGGHSYETEYQCTWGNFGCTYYGKQSANFGKTYYNWDDMPLTGSTRSVALLMYHCGVATEMDYSRIGDWSGKLSSTTKIGPAEISHTGSYAMEHHFRYTLKYAGEQMYHSDTGEQWEDMLKRNLSAGRPILYGGFLPDLSSGHAFVCDGYDDTGKFHFNWGWKGDQDGYYSLSGLTPAGSDFTSDQRAVFDIQPEYNSVVWVDDDYAGLPAGTPVGDGHIYGTDAFSSVQEGINRVDEGGTVVVYEGGYYEHLEVDKSITLQHYTGESELDRPRIYGRTEPKPVLKVTAPGASIVLEGLILREGVGVYFDGSRKGGGLCVVSAKDVIVDDCVFLRNNLPDTGNGGGMYAQNTVVDIRDCYFLSNSGTIGGGLSLVNCTGNVSKCTFESNDSASYGGGIYLKGSVTPLIADCVFKENDSNFGGGIFTDQNTVANVRNCRFQNNTAYHRGGGMYNWTGSNVTLTNCTFHGNAGTYTPPKEGGGIANSGCTPEITNCILWNNTPDQMHSTVGAPVVTYCDIAQAGFGAADGSADANGNINMDPMFVNAAGGVFNLLEGSPCIDAGSNGAVPSDMETDMDGNPRIKHGDCDGVAGVDMGVYEYVYTLPLGDTTGDCAVDYDDLLMMASVWLDFGCDDCILSDLDGDGDVDLADLGILAEHWREGV